MKKIERSLSLFLAVFILVMALPIGEFVAWAEEEEGKDKKNESPVTIIEEYTGSSTVRLKNRRIVINALKFSDNFDDVIVAPDEGNDIKEYRTDLPDQGQIVFDFGNNDIDGRITVFAKGKPEGENKKVVVYIKGTDIAVISGTNPSSGIVGQDGNITINGSNLSKGDMYLSTKAGNFKVTNKEGEVDKELKLNMGNYPSAIGNISIRIEHGEKDVNRISTYRDLIKRYGDLDINNAYFTPTKGKLGQDVRLIADKLPKLDEVSVFMTKDTEAPLTKDHMTKAESSSIHVEDKDSYRFKVPKSLENVYGKDNTNGDYYIVITNKVDDPNDIVARHIMSEQFTVISGNNVLGIENVVESNDSIEGGKIVRFTGKYISIMAGVDHEIGNKDSYFKGRISESGKSIILEDKNGKLDKNDYESLEREVTVTIAGKPVDIVLEDGKEDEKTIDLSPGGIRDSFNIRVPAIGEDDNLNQPVRVEVKTTIDYGACPSVDNKDKSVKKEENNKICGEKIIIEEAIWGKMFEYYPSSYEAEISEVVPNPITYEKNADGKTGLIKPDGLELVIKGENFFVHNYDKKTKYPVLRLGGEHINLNDDGIKFSIYNSKGEIVDGTKNHNTGEINNLGNKLVVRLPDSIKVSESDINRGRILLEVINPLANNEDPVVPEEGELEEEKPKEYEGLDISKLADFDLDLRPLNTNKRPVITKIDPDRIPSEIGYKGVVITGSNFDKDTKVYIEGEEVENLKIDTETGNKMTFDLGPKPEGKYQVLVQGYDGSLSTEEVIYVRSYTDIVFTSFEPKKGTEDTLVTVTGAGFVRAANSYVTDISDLGLDKLIGTKVLMDGKDINEYNDKGMVAFPPKDLIGVKDGSVKLSDDHRSIFLRRLQDGEETGAYHSIYYDQKDGKYKISDGDKSSYTLSTKDGENVLANGKKISVDGKTLTIGDEEFSILTPYKVSGGKIVGNRVKIMSNNELQFNVPKKDRSKFYDLTVINPDTNSQSKVGNQGFYYEPQPRTNPKIDYLEPGLGSVGGGYYVKIHGSGFVDASDPISGVDRKPKVTIGSEPVDPKDVHVSQDGKTIEVKVPAYPGDLEKETDLDRKTVSVVVVNHDGGSASKDDGFTYVLPVSKPEIDRIEKDKASASGEDIVTVWGKDFRFFEPYKGDRPGEDDKNFEDINKNGVWDELEVSSGLAEIYIPDEGKKKLADLTDEEWEKYVKPILPKVYFAGKEAEVLRLDNYSSGSIPVRVPDGLTGEVEVYVLNNDQGKSAAKKFVFETTSPVISNIAPGEGTKFGGVSVELLGRDFERSKVEVHRRSDIKEENLYLVRFGELSDLDISNVSRGLDQPGSGTIKQGDNNPVKVQVGDLYLEYGILDKKLSLDIKTGDGKDEKVYRYELKDYDGREIYVSTKAFKEVKEGEEYYPHDELIKINIEEFEGNRTKRVRVDRGYATNSRKVRENQIDETIQIAITSPNYYKVGETEVSLINPDKKQAKTQYIHRNPDSKPKITNITSDGLGGYDPGDGRKIVEVNYLGGNLIEIEGIDFRKPVRITIGGEIIIPSSIIKYEPVGDAISNKLIFEMPAQDRRYTKEGPLQVLVTNTDGGNALSHPHYIKFIEPETVDMSITSIVPNRGPTKGGTEAIIYGNDFRKTLDGKGEIKVYFLRDGRQEEAEVLDVGPDNKTIRIKTPPFSAGITDLKVVNPDGNIKILENAFTYTSDPTITSVVEADNEDIIIKTISFEGGERIKLKGTDFLEGAKVIFNPQLEEIADDEGEANIPGGGQIVVINGKRYVLKSGSEGTEVEVVDGQNILVTTPKGKLGDKGVLVINPDGGVSNVYNLEYGIPEVGAPMDVRAELVHDEFIRVSWSAVRNAIEYEIYVSKNDGEFHQIGATDQLFFAYKDIEPNTTYQFMVRASGKYGTSKYLDESKSNRVRTGSVAGPEDLDGELGEETVINVSKDKADIVIGRDIGSKGKTIDLTRGELAGVKDVTIRMAASTVANKSVGNIRVKSKDYSLEFKPSVFANKRINDNKDNKNAGVVFKINSYKGPEASQNKNLIVSPIYSLEGEIFIGRDRTKVDKLAGGMKFKLDENESLKKNRRVRTTSLARYYQEGKNWIDTENVDRMALYAVRGRR